MICTEFKCQWPVPYTVKCAEEDVEFYSINHLVLETAFPIGDYGEIRLYIMLHYYGPCDGTPEGHNVFGLASF